MHQNATSIVRKFSSLHGLKMLLANELEALRKARAAALTQLQKLAAATAKAAPEFVEQAGQCGR